jgi:hypothetical protein
MKLNDKDVDWEGVARLLNEANEVLEEKFRKLDQKYFRLQVQNKKMKVITELVNKGIN